MAWALPAAAALGLSGCTSGGRAPSVAASGRPIAPDTVASKDNPDGRRRNRWVTVVVSP